MKMHFEEYGRLVKDSSERITAEDASAAGRAFGRVSGGKICVGYSGASGADALAAAFAAGVCSSGADAVFAGRCSAPSLAYAVKRLGCSGGCHAAADFTAGFTLFADDGLYPYPDTEETVEKLLECSSDVPYSRYGSMMHCEGINEVYLSGLSELLCGHLNGVFADTASPSREITDCMSRVLAGKTDRTGLRIAFHINGDGSRVSAYSDKTGYVFHDKLLMICARDLFSCGYDVADCPALPEAALRMAEEFGRNVISCGRNICTSSSQRTEKCRKARALAAKQSFMTDGCALALTVLEIMRRRGVFLDVLAAEIPAYAVSTRYIPFDRPSELLKKLCSVTGQSAMDGVLRNSSAEKVTIRPVRTGKGMMLCVESFGGAAETASELCDFYRSMLEDVIKSGSCQA